MPEDGSEDLERVKQRWDERAKRYDEYYAKFRGAVEQQVEWELLQRFLPQDRDASILDTAGGTGRMTLLLAKMGYRVTLSDISPGMLKVARTKLRRERVLDRVNVVEADVCELPFRDSSFDLVLCWGGGMKAASELARVTKHTGRMSTCVPLRCGNAIHKFAEDPEHALALLSGQSDYDDYEDDRYQVLDEGQLRALLDQVGIRLIGLYAYDLWRALAIPADVLESQQWSDESLRQTTEILLRLAEEPSVRGVSSHAVLYGEKM